MFDNYTNFFIASTGASAAFIGLLFVGMSVVNAEDTNYATRERRVVLEGSSFLALIDIFFVSMISLLGSVKISAEGNLLMAVIGVWATILLVKRAARAGNFARKFVTRRQNIIFASMSVSLYALQLIAALMLFNNQQNADAVLFLLLIIIGLYASALARAWVITGISNHLTK